MSFYQMTSGVLTLKLHIQPGAKKSALVGLYGDRLKIKIHAPPVDGKANEEVIRFISEWLKVAKSQVNIQSGETSRQKTIAVRGLEKMDWEKILLQPHF